MIRIDVNVRLDGHVITVRESAETKADVPGALDRAKAIVVLRLDEEEAAE